MNLKIKRNKSPSTCHYSTVTEQSNPNSDTDFNNEDIYIFKK